MIAINSKMFHELQLRNVLNGSFRAKETTFNRKYKGKGEAGEEILFNHETGETALVKMKIISTEKQHEKKKVTLPYVIHVHFDLIRVIDKGGDVPNFYQDYIGINKAI